MSYAFEAVFPIRGGLFTYFVERNIFSKDRMRYTTSGDTKGRKRSFRGSGGISSKKVILETNTTAGTSCRSEKPRQDWD